MPLWVDCRCTEALNPSKNTDIVFQQLLQVTTHSCINHRCHKFNTQLKVEVLVQKSTPLKAEVPLHTLCSSMSTVLNIYYLRCHIMLFKFQCYMYTHRKTFTSRPIRTERDGVKEDLKEKAAQTSLFSPKARRAVA